jgi:hypothetical protein
MPVSVVVINMLKRIYEPGGRPGNELDLVELNDE